VLDKPSLFNVKNQLVLGFIDSPDYLKGIHDLNSRKRYFVSH